MDINFENERIHGNIYFKQHEYGKALEVYMSACSKAENVLETIICGEGENCENKNMITDQLSLLYFNISVAYTKLGFFDEAMKFIDNAISMNPTDRVLSRKALIYSKKGKYREALEICEKVRDKKELKLLADTRCPEMEDLFKVMHYPFDMKYALKFEEEELVVDIELLQLITEEYKNNNILPAKLVCAILREGYALLNNLDNVIFLDTQDEVFVFGDTHGQYFDVITIINEINLKKNVKVVFNGDFVDRGPNSIENFIFLLLLKIVFPEKVHLNRGNHEFGDMNRMMGFLAEIKNKYKLMHDLVYFYFSNVFSLLPIVTILNRKVFITHGGLPSECVSIDDIQCINRKVQASCTDPRFIGLMWSDPGEILQESPSKRGIGIVFGKCITSNFLERNGLKLIVRSHEFFPNGFNSHHDGNVVTVFSAPNYCQNVNDGAFLHFRWDDPEDTKYTVVTFKAHTRKESIKFD